MANPPSYSSGDVEKPDIHANGYISDSKPVLSQNGNQADPKTTMSCTQSFSGPTIEGRETEVTQYSTTQLAKFDDLPQLYKVINDAFDVGHTIGSSVAIASQRLRSDTQFLEELGNDPSTFTYILRWSGTNEIVATSTGKRYYGDDIIPGNLRTAGEMFSRHGLVPADAEGWELSTMAVDPKFMRKGIAGWLMKNTVDEIKRRFKASALKAKENGGVVPEKLILMLTTVKEINGEFYGKRGFSVDYETTHEKGALGSQTGFHIVHMSKPISLEEL